MDLGYADKPGAASAGAVNVTSPSRKLRVKRRYIQTARRMTSRGKQYPAYERVRMNLGYADKPSAASAADAYVTTPYRKLAPSEDGATIVS